MHVRSGHLRCGAKLIHHDRQTLLHLRVIGQVLGHVGIDIRVEHHNTADDRQCYRDSE